MSNRNHTRTKPFRAQIAEAFKDHEIKDQPAVKSWRVGNRDGSGIYAFIVTWSRGVLALAGDLGELTITHYHAMPTWESAIRWLHNSDFSYIMSKSNAVKKYDPEASLRRLIYQCDEDQKWDNAATYWQRVFDKHDWRLPLRCDDKEWNHKNKAHQSAMIRCLRGEMGEHDFHNLATCSDDYYAEQSYTMRHRWQFEALQLWAKMAIETLPAEKVAA